MTKTAWVYCDCTCHGSSGMIRHCDPCCNGYCRTCGRYIRGSMEGHMASHRNEPEDEADTPVVIEEGKK